jgi:hypothetical protein
MDPEVPRVPESSMEVRPDENSEMLESNDMLEFQYGSPNEDIAFGVGSQFDACCAIHIGVVLHAPQPGVQRM